MLQSRAIIEQAKGAIMVAVAWGPDEAWHLLRAVSQHHNVRLRDIAVALVELLSGTTAQHPAGLPIPPEVAPAARDSAATLWKNLTCKPHLPTTSGGHELV